MSNEVLTSVGEYIDGLYRVGSPIAYSAAGAVVQTEFGPNALPAVMKIRESRADDSDALLERWRNAVELEHPNLLRVYAAGSSVLNEVPVNYVVMERAEESLENVLGERALTADEMRSVLAPALAGLQYLHKSGYAHSHLVPSNVLAVGEHLKLSCENATRLSIDDTASEDMRALGVLMVQALTQKVPTGYAGLDEPVLAEIPAPFQEIIRHCLDPDPDSRWTADQVDAHLNGSATPPLVEENRSALADERPVVDESPALADNPAFQDEPVVQHQPRIAPLPERPARRDWRAEEYGTERPSRAVPRWVYAGAAALILVAVVTAFSWKSDPQPRVAATSTVVTPPAQQTAPPERAIPEAAPVPPPQTAPVANSTPRSAPAPPPARTVAKTAGEWSVIVATYNSRDLAEKRRLAIAKRWPNFKAAVFNPESENSRYLITLGQGLSQDQAEALRKRAVQSGLPRDTYIKRIF